MIDASKENPHLAQKLHDVLLESGVIAPPNLFSEIYNELGSPTEEKDEHKPESGQVPDMFTYNTLIDGLGKSGRISCASKLLVEMHNKGQPADIITYNSLLDAMFNIKQHDKALMLFIQMKESGIDPNICTYSILIDGLCKSGRLMDAKEIFQDLCIKNHRPNVRTYTIMINGLCKEGLFEEALSLLLEMEDNDCLSNAVTIETVIHTLFEKIRMT
ncbi:pentatricopeptide repeat-containing protein At5g46100-like [Arachis ipaensis]|uniref:pentatricopeptide repeat-containing protein At5g46100-like n=1 Tax=Arachis ipaensis TaxID=130454 RepID=UPI0007AF41E9|nr:pentatricopeptide repeat-containing protein At5g46100-like [Arachis ipaensis]